MCGITGYFNYANTQTILDEIIIDRMKLTLSPRGPDGNSSFFNQKVALAHTRLAILDLSPENAQPFFDSTDRYVIVFNGEIYNYIEVRETLIKLGHSFRTAGDTEVIVEAYKEWGEDSPTHFNGIWAFAIYDTQENTMFCSRDRLGVKPFCYTEVNGIFIFGSEIKAILQHPSFIKSPNYEAIWHFFACRVIPEPFTAFNNIFRLKPGTNVTIRLGQITHKKYWSLVDVFSQSADPRTESSIKDELEELIEDSVRLQLRADVPVGSFLSGGVDSTAITYFASKMLNPIKMHTFSMILSEPGSDVGTAFDENKYAQECADMFQTIHHTSEYSGQDINNRIRDFIKIYDEPCASAIPNFYVSKMARQHVKVAFGGIGPDEAFAGYSRFRTVHSRDQYKNYQFSFANNQAQFFNPGKIFQPTCDFIYNQTAEAKPIDLISWISLQEINFYMRDDLLRYVDCMSMAHGLEVRVPFCDHRIIEMAAKIPGNLKLNRGVSENFQNKYIIKQIVDPYVPANVCRRPKMGFSMPFEAYLDDGGALNKLLRDNLTKSNVEKRGIFNWNAIENMLKQNCKGQSTSIPGLKSYPWRYDWATTYGLWSMLVVELWFQEYFDKG